MPFAVQLFFDPASETEVRRVWAELASAGLPFPMHDSGRRPHFSLGIYAEIDHGVYVDRLKSFAETHAPFSLSFTSLGIFPGERALVFLAPSVSMHLLDLHRQIHQLLPDSSTRSWISSAYYLPDHWTPHCTIAKRVPPQMLPQAINFALPFSTFSIGVEEIGVIEYPPTKHLFSFRLTGAE